MAMNEKLNMIGSGLQKLVHYCAPKTSIRHTKKPAPKINSNVYFTKIKTHIWKSCIGNWK